METAVQSGTSVNMHCTTRRRISDAGYSYSPPYRTQNVINRRSQWPCVLRRRSAADRLLGLRVRIPPRAWMFVSCTVFVLSGRGLCDGPDPSSRGVRQTVVCV
jgi:hypothetical protein